MADLSLPERGLAENVTDVVRNGSGLTYSSAMRIHHLNCISTCPLGGRLMDGRTAGLRGLSLELHVVRVVSRCQASPSARSGMATAFFRYSCARKRWRSSAVSTRDNMTKFRKQTRRTAPEITNANSFGG